MIHFNEPILLENALTYVREAIHNKKLSGDGEFTKRCSYWLGKWCGTEHVFLTTSCTHATEMAAILAGISPGDEVIMPAYTFVSTADAFVLRGAKVKFVDIRPDTMNMDEMLIENAITKRTKAIIPVHYAGVGCEMDAIMDVAKRHHLLVIEDAAQGVMSTYKGQALGAIGDYGCYSFHETKNYSMGEGGAIVVKNKEKVELAEIIREKGTNRSKYFRGQIDKYTWVEAGSSYLPSELNAAYLWAQLEQAEEIFQNRMKTWNMYQEGLQRLEESGRLQLPFIPTECVHNAHMFYIKTESLGERTELISFMKSKGINLAFHYVPLHTAPAGIKYGEFIGEDRYTTAESERLVRLPLYYGIKEIDVERVIDNILMFYLDRGGMLMKDREDVKKIADYLFLHGLFLLYSFGGVCSKFAGQAGIGSMRFWFFYGVLLLILTAYALLWQKILKKMPLATAYANKSVTLLWGMLWGVCFFYEKITMKQILGASVILIGIFLMVKKNAA